MRARSKALSWKAQSPMGRQGCFSLRHLHIHPDFKIKFGKVLILQHLSIGQKNRCLTITNSLFYKQARELEFTVRTVWKWSNHAQPWHKAQILRPHLRKYTRDLWTVKAIYALTHTLHLQTAGPWQPLAEALEAFLWSISNHDAKKDGSKRPPSVVVLS